MTDATSVYKRPPIDAADHLRAKTSLLVAVITTSAATLSFAVLGSQAIIIFAILACAGIALAMLRWPDLATVVAVALIYSNLPVVAVKVHGAPGILPAAAVGLLFWPLFFRIFIRGEKLLLLPSTPWVGFLIVVQGLGVWWSSDVSYSMEHFISFLLEGAALYFVLINAVRTRALLLACFWSLTCCAILMGIFPLVQQLLGVVEFDFWGLAQVDAVFKTDEGALRGEALQRRAAGTIGEQNRYAQFMIMLAPIGLCMFYAAKRKPARWLAAVGAITAVLGFALAFSRGAAVGVAMTVVIATVTGILTRRQAKQLLLLASLTLLLLPQYLARLSSLGGLLSVVSQSPGGLDETDGAVRGRMTEMLAAALAFRDHPLIGLGPGMFQKHSQAYGQIIGLRPLPEGRQAHSLPLDIAAEHGLLGIVAMTGLVFVMFRGLVRARNAALTRGDTTAAQMAAAMLLMLLLYLTSSLFLHLSYVRYFWLMVGLCETVAFIILHGERGGNYLPQWRPTMSYKPEPRLEH